MAKQRTHVAHRLLALPQADEIQNLGGIGQRILHLFGQVGIAVLAHRHVIYIGDLGAHRIQASLDRQRRKSRVVLDPVETFFGDREYDFSILHDGSRGVRVKHVEAEDQHAVLNFSQES